MATERQSPDTIAAQTNLSGVVGDIQDDPDSPDANWMVASGNSVNVDVRVTLPSPTGNPTVGADLQEFKAWVRQFDTGQTGDPTARIELWENGVLVRVGSDVSITGSGQMVTFTWNANELGTADGSLVECKVVGIKSGGGPSKRNSLDVGAIEWNVNYSAGLTVVSKNINLKWDVRAVVPKANQYIWNVRSIVSKNLIIIWNVRRLVTVTLNIIWNIRKTVTKTLQAIWNVLANSTVVSKTLNIRWDIRSVVPKNLSIQWNVRALVSKNLQLIWSVRTVISKSLQIIWNILSGSAVVSKTLNFRWDVRSVVSKNVNVRWDVRAVVSKTIQVIWNVKSLVSKTIRFVWRVSSKVDERLNLLDFYTHKLRRSMQKR